MFFRLSTPSNLVRKQKDYNYNFMPYTGTSLETEVSITATIDAPKNYLEANFNIPICSEPLYKQIILVVANSYHLPIFSDWGTFVEIDVNNFGSFNKQLGLLKEGIKKLQETPTETKVHVLERLDMLQKSMAKVIEKEMT